MAWNTCRSWQHLLRLEGYEPLKAGGVAEALRVAGERRPRAALIDIHLPDGSGISLLAELKKSYPDTCCIIVTGRADVESAISALANDAFDYLLKPVMPERMLATLQRAFEMMDLTEKERRANEALGQSEAMLRGILQAIPDLLMVHAADGRVLFSNGRGYAPETGLNGLACPVRPAPCEPALVREVFQSGQARRLETTSAEDGRTLEVSLYPMRDESGAVTMVIEHARDITEKRAEEMERKRLETKILQTQKLESLGILAGGIAHDFNNLLMGILGNAGLALQELPEGASARPYVLQAERSGLRAADLVKQMLTYAGRGSFLRQEVSLRQLVEGMAQLLDSSVSKKARIEYQFAPDLPSIRGDSTQLRHLVLNLVSNATEAIGDRPGTVAIATGMEFVDHAHPGELYLADTLAEGPYVYLEISDTGCGMDAQTKARIFDPFFTTKFTGRGLGLAGVLGIVRAHKGNIRVTSEPGHGSAFRVLFPCEALVERAAADAATGRGEKRGGAKTAETILLVDDEAIVRDVAKIILERAGFGVLTAGDGQEALDVFRSFSGSVDCVVLDMTMPRLGGEETLRQMRRLRPEVPVILSSGYNEDQVLAHAGFAAFIHKPYRPEDLINKVREALGR
ncbi:MAG: response regulator [Candidatus Sumerlaeota bacterium]|nr:response regulator [Candidatus Sumerlaeota bacterium]